MQLKDMLGPVKTTKKNRAPKAKAAEAVLGLASPAAPLNASEGVITTEVVHQAQPSSRDTFGKLSKPLGSRITTTVSDQVTTSVHDSREKKKKRTRDALVEANKKMKTISELQGPSLFGELIVPRITFGDGIIEVPEYQLLPNWELTGNDRLSVDTSLEFVKESIPPRDKEALRSFEKSELRRRTALGGSQTLALIGELIARSENDEAVISKLYSDMKALEKERDDLESFNQDLGYREQKLKTELGKSHEDLLVVEEKNAKLEAKVLQLERQLSAEQAKKTYFKGEGSSELVHRMFCSTEFGKFLGKIMEPAKDYGYHLALANLHTKYPDLGLKDEPGYDSGCDADMDEVLDELKAGKIVIPIESFVPSSPSIDWISDEEVVADHDEGTSRAGNVEGTSRAEDVAGTSRAEDTVT